LRNRKEVPKSSKAFAAQVIVFTPTVIHTLCMDSALLGWRSGLHFKSFDHLDQSIFKAFPILRCLNGATGQFSDPCYLFAQHLTPQWPEVGVYCLPAAWI
jgi:hypothetical protein